MEKSHSKRSTNIPSPSIKVLVPPALHNDIGNWIIFSDLHVKDSSIDTCEAVLDEVQRVAFEKHAGIIFLGDFWHVRGTLSVNLLNRVLARLKAWTQPVIFIPGNHDQASSFGINLADRS